MRIKFIENLLDRIAEYLPDDEPATEQERIYEEGKKRVYEMHQKETDIFYVEEAWLDKEKAKVFGEIALGNFSAFDQVLLLNAHGETLLEGEILSVEKVFEQQEETEESEKRCYLIFDGGKLKEQEDFFVQTYYVVKKH